MITHYGKELLIAVCREILEDPEIRAEAKAQLRAAMQKGAEETTRVLNGWTAQIKQARSKIAVAREEAKRHPIKQAFHGWCICLAAAVAYQYYRARQAAKNTKPADGEKSKGSKKSAIGTIIPVTIGVILAASLVGDGISE